MKIVVVTITVLLFSCFAFGQKVATTADDKITAEIEQLFKDAETDFASFQGEVQNRGGGIITYQTTKNYFQSAGFTSWFRYYEAEKTIGLQFSGSGKSAEQVFNLVKEKLNSNAEIKSSGSSDEFFVNGQRIALLEKSSDKFAMWFYSNRSVWHDFNDPFHFNFKNFLAFEKPLMDIDKDVNSNYEALAKQCDDLFYGKNDFVKAIETCTEAIKLKGDNAELYQIRGLAYYLAPDKPKSGLDALTSFGSANKNAAIADLTKCTTIAPTRADCFYSLGYVQLQELKSDELDQATKSFSEAIRLKTTREDVYYHRGESYRQYYSTEEFFGNKDTQIRQRKELAIADYKKDIELRPTSYDSWVGRGLTYLDLDKYELAVADFTKALALLNSTTDQNSNDRRSILENRARAYMNLGKNTEYCNDMKAIGKACEK